MFELISRLSPVLRTDCEPLAEEHAQPPGAHAPAACVEVSQDRLRRYQGRWVAGDLFLEAHERAPREIVLDLDNTDIPLHGEQKGRFFHGYYSKNTK